MVNRKELQPKIIIKEYNNKSRKGTYLYLKYPKKHAGIYRLKGQAYDPIIEYYKAKSQGKTLGTYYQYIKTYDTAAQGQYQKGKLGTTAKRYVQKIKKKPIFKEIKKGQTYSVIQDALTASQTEINKANKELLKRLIWHPEILKLMMTEENMTKIRGLLETRIEIKNEKGQTTITANRIGKTTKETVEELKKHHTKGEHEPLDKNYPITHKMKQNGWQNVTKQSGGTTVKIRLTTILRRA